MIEQRTENLFTIVTLSGKLMGGPETDEFRKCVKDLQKKGVDNLILDLGHVRWINSAGIGALISGFATFKRSKGTIKFVNLSPKVKDVLTITKLSTILDIYDSLENARK